MAIVGPRRLACGCGTHLFVLVLMSGALGGCSGLTTNEVVVEAPVLPVPAAEPIPTRVGVVFSDELRTAKIETAYRILNDQWVWRHDIGAAAVAGVRRALSTTFADLVELERLPTHGDGRHDLAAVIVPALPSMYAVMSMRSVVSLYRQGIEFAFGLHAPTGEIVAEWKAEGTAGIGAHGPSFVRQRALDQATLRSAMAAFIASLHREPALAFLRPAAGGTGGSPSDGSAAGDTHGVVVLRLDAGLPSDDGIEKRVATCLAPVSAPARGLPGAQPAAALRDALFPWLDPGVAPQRAEDIEALLAQPRVRERLKQLGVSHLVLITARDGDRSKTENLGCFGGFGAGGCFGLYEEESGYVVDLAVWDAAARRPVGSGTSDYKRTLGVLGALLPIPYTSTNETESCAQMREAVRKALSAAR